MPNLLSNTLALVGGAAAGAVAMYLLDPDQGQDRREDVSGTAADAVASTHKAVRTTVSGASDSASSVANTIAKYAKNLAGKASEQVGDATDAVRGSVSDATDSAHSVASRIASYAKDLAARVSGQVSDTADSAAASVKSAKKQAKSLGRSTVKQAKATQEDWWDRTSSIPDRLRSAGRRALGVAEPESHPVVTATSITAGTIGVLAVGAGLMYFMDPQRGRARRALLRDKTYSITRQSGHKVRQYGHHLGNKALGYAAQARNAVPDEWVDKAKSVVTSATGGSDAAIETSMPSPVPTVD